MFIITLLWTVFNWFLGIAALFNILKLTVTHVNWEREKIDHFVIFLVTCVSVLKYDYELVLVLSYFTILFVTIL